MSCELNLALNIGIVKPDPSDAYATEALYALNAIFDDINDAFKDINSDGLTLYEYDNWDDLQDASADGKVFCFTMGWNSYVNNPTATVPERDFSLEVRTSFEWMNMTDTNISQKRFYQASYSPKSLNPFNATDYL